MIPPVGGSPKKRGPRAGSVCLPQGVSLRGGKKPPVCSSGRLVLREHERECGRTSLCSCFLSRSSVGVSLSLQLLRCIFQIKSQSPPCGFRWWALGAHVEDRHPSVSLWKLDLIF